MFYFLEFFISFVQILKLSQSIFTKLVKSVRTNFINFRHFFKPFATDHPCVNGKVRIDRRTKVGFSIFRELLELLNTEPSFPVHSFADVK
jgi:hypothetical protein